MKKLILLIPLAFLVACATVKEGNDPVVVNAERATRSAVDIVDAFLKFEFQNRHTLVNEDLYHFAESVREEAPTIIASVRFLTQTYKLNRTPENEASLMTGLALLQGMLNEVNKFIIRYGMDKPSMVEQPQ